MLDHGTYRPDTPHPVPDSEEKGRRLQDCVPYLMAVANRELPSDLIPKGGASDLVQDTLLEAHRDYDHFQGETPEEFRAWLRQILLNNLANFLRRFRLSKKRQVGREVPLAGPKSGVEPHPEPVGAAASPSAVAIRSEVAEIVAVALGRLQERERRVVLWRYRDQCSFDEIGQRLGGTPDMARKVWVRALERLRAEVGPLFDFPSHPDGLG